MTKKKYEVKVDDNYHYMDESERYNAGSFSSLEKAVEKCKEVTVNSLKDCYEEGTTPEKLSAQWAMFGDDPFIQGAPEGEIPFSARSFVTEELCKQVIEEIKKDK